MTADPRAALATLVAAFERHLDASATRRGENDPAVVAAYQDLADAFDVYDDLLLDSYGEVTPLEIYSGPFDDEDTDADEDDLDDEDEDDDDDEEDQGGQGAQGRSPVAVVDELDDHDDEDDDEGVYVGLNDSDYDREERERPIRPGRG